MIYYPRGSNARVAAGRNNDAEFRISASYPQPNAGVMQISDAII
jgi:hypothetical protein